MASAFEQCVDAFKVRSAAAGLNAKDHRDESNSVAREELDCVVFTFIGAPVVMLDSGNEYMLRVQVVADFYGYARTGVSAFSACCNQIVIANAVVQTANITDNWGELFHDCRPNSVTEPKLGAESCVMSVVYDVEFRVAKGDWSQILTA